jgi:hypothetical protein
MREHLELPRPLLLVRTVLWNLTEAAGLPVGAAVLATWMEGRNAGLLAGLAATWLTVVIRKVATRQVPSLLVITALVLTMQTVVVLATGQLWLYLLQFPLAQFVMCVLFARTARGPSPLVARLAAEVIALRQPATHHPGLHRFFQGATWFWAGNFFLMTVGMGILMVTEPVGIFVLVSTVATAGLTVAGAGVSALWFRRVLRQFGLSLRFAPPKPAAAVSTGT